MKFAQLYRASMYVMLTLATLVLSIDATQYNRFALLYPLGVAGLGVVAFLTVDRDPRRGLTRDLANFLAMGSFGLALLEYWSDPDTMLTLAMGHWLVYLQLVEMFLPKTVEVDWFLFMLGMMQVVVGVFISTGDEVGTLLFCWALTALWTLGLFHLHREAGRAEPQAGAAVLPRPVRDDPYPGLIRPSFLLETLRVAATALALGSFIFLFLPRWGTGPGTARRPAAAKHLTGFSDEVRLGQMGEILENDSVVMSVETLNPEGRSVQPDAETRWRGVTLVNYEDGRWSRGPIFYFSLPLVTIDDIPRDQLVRQQIRLEATDSEVLFGARPILDARSRQTVDLGLNAYDGTIYRRDQRPDYDYEGRPPRRPGSFDYEVTTLADADAIQPGEQPPPGELRRALIGLPESIRPRLRKLVEEALGRPVDGLRAPERPSSSRARPPIVPDPEAAERDRADREARARERSEREARARRLEWFLRDSGRYSYTLRMDVVDRALDPVVDFLENRKQGHCTYFASGLALLLRSIQIPARVVNGFKGGDWNDLARVTTVRAKHAHSWVEALVGYNDRGQPIWITLDPTPAGQQAAVVARVGGVATRFRFFSDFVRWVWTFYVVGFDQDRQFRLLYGPALILLGQAGYGFGMIGQAIRGLFGSTFYFESYREFFSFRGFLVSFTTLLALALAFSGLRRFVRFALRRLRASGRADAALAAGVAFYHRLARLLARRDLVRLPHETPREFALRAGKALAAADLDGPEPAVAEVPALVVDAFYLVRFGHETLPPDALARIESRLDALEQRLAASGA